MSMAGIWLRVALLFTRLGRIKWTLGENGNWLDQRANVAGALARAGGRTAAYSFRCKRGFLLRWTEPLWRGGPRCGFRGGTGPPDGE